MQKALKRNKRLRSFLWDTFEFFGWVLFFAALAFTYIALGGCANTSDARLYEARALPQPQSCGVHCVRWFEPGMMVE